MTRELRYSHRAANCKRLTSNSRVTRELHAGHSRVLMLPVTGTVVNTHAIEMTELYLYPLPARISVVSYICTSIVLHARAMLVLKLYHDT